MSGFNVKWFVVAILFTAFIIFLTHLPVKQSHSGLIEKVPSVLAVSRSGAVEHIFAYGIITLLFLFAFRPSLSSLSKLLVFLLFVGSLSAFDELTQPFVNRTASFSDWLANEFGVSCVLLLSIVLRSQFAKSQPKS